MLKRLIRIGAKSGFWSSITMVLAFASVMAVGARMPVVLIITPFAIALAILAVRHRRGFSSFRSSVRAVNSYLVTRFLLLATGMVYGLTAVTPPKLIWTSGALLALALAAEPIVRHLHGRAAPYATGFPDARPRNDRKFPYGVLFPLNIFGTTMLFICALFWGGGWWAPLAFGILAVVSAIACLWDLFARILSRFSFEDRIEEHIDALQPAFAVHWSAPPRASYQLGMWLPYLERLNVPFVIITRNRKNFQEARALTDRPIVMRTTMESIENVIRPSLRGVFYFNNATNNAHLIRFSQLTHVQLNHGDSDKAPSWNPAFRMYDYDFVAGQAAIDRFANNGVKMLPEAFRIVGRPQVEDVDVVSEEIGSHANPTVLYAPTWAGFHGDSSYSSLPVAAPVIQNLLDRGCRIVFRPHPFSHRNAELRMARSEIIAMLEQHAAATGMEHLYGPVAEHDMSVIDCFNASDAMISDVSSVVGDFLFSGKPLAMFSTTVSAAEFIEQVPMARAAYILDAHAGSIDDLDAVLEEMLGRDPLRDTRRELKTYYLGDLPTDGYAQRFVDEATDVLGLNARDREEHNGPIQSPPAA